MPQILFRGTTLRYIDLRRDEGGSFTRLHLTADYSEPVQQSMGWEPIPESVTTCKLAGKIAAVNMVLTPTDKALQRNEIQMEASEVGDFALVPTKNDEGDVTGHELRFVLRTNESAAWAALGQYFMAIGQGTALLTVTYAEQTTLDSQPTQGNLVEMPDASDSDASNEDEKEVEGLPVSVEPPLASAVQVAGNTDKLRKARRDRQSRQPIPADPGAPEWRTAEEIAEGVPHHIDRSVQ